ncbi:endonuclease/exonuclease/phosphatase family protein [Pedobacter metabolipauper]|uniref:Endonuclease/exonuclease/phosphatase family metal-dependent hydrolase n=1 Tax=Pedobacter metabolipauper TaxID=425513 RepID=A0A4R6SZU7_9SPHI|nr:endonuclease/exonuclease/phosphatase family protein [Pedobacter metabolipauper]TDQ11289.1 endonuclease/exonuclease/phosphatase family metal-dependent hydrolase [Pedobacter metabolipauper]
MKIKHLIFSVALAAASFTANAQKYTVGSFNVRYDNAGDTGNRWEQRGPVSANLIRFHQFDVFGIQEGLKNQVDDLGRLLPEFEHYGLGRDDGKDAGEHSSIFWRKDKFKALKKGDFWLSETPDVPGKGWDATCCNRICTWVYLEDLKTGKKFYYFNAHFDHQGKIARVESGKLIAKKIKEIAGTVPAIFTGDLNGGQKSDWYLTLANSGILTDTYTQVKYPYANNSSFNSFGKNVDGYEIIDHVFVTKGFTAQRWGILTDTYHAKFPSDHFPILVDVVLK